MTAEVPRQDPRLIYRIVGFVEYGRAVNLLDRFVKGASDAELKLADEIVRESPRYTVYTNLARRIEGVSSLKEVRIGADDDFARLGLEWIMALARVELGAMLAGFTSHPRPFHLVAPNVVRKGARRVTDAALKPRKAGRNETPATGGSGEPAVFGSGAFLEILADGLRMHYWALHRDPVLRNYLKTGIPENHIITYGRRVSMTRHFLAAVRDFLGHRLSRIQAAETVAWDNMLRRYQLVYLYCLALKQKSQQTSGRKVVRTEGLRACPPLKAAAMRELGLQDTGTRTQSSEQFSITPYRNRLAEILRTIDPTLIACPCR